MLLIKNAQVYTPDYLGKQDILIAGEKIERIAPTILACEGMEVLDAEDQIVIPGIIDRHVHITGGGGEGGFFTQAPPVTFSQLIEAGITTVVGVLGTDGLSRSVENLLAKTKALNEEGMTAYCTCGAYGYPSPTITGSISKDIMFIQEILGLKLAVSDHRAPNITTEELIRVASDTRVAGMLSGKAGFVCIHMGNDTRGMEQIFEALEKTSLPAKIFQPTHVTRKNALLSDAFRLAKMGGYIDMTCGTSLKKKDSISAKLIRAKEEGVPLDHITFSSDGQGSFSEYDKDGKLTKIGYSPVGTVLEQIQYLVKNEILKMEEAVLFGTSNPAKALEIFPKKGVLQEGSDADLLLLKRDNLDLERCVARGKIFLGERE